MLLVVTAVPAEAGAVLAGLSGPADPVEVGPYRAQRRGAVVVLAGGIGPAAAAAATATALAHLPVRRAVSVGVGGGFGLPAGALVVASTILTADLGADSPEGFLGAAALGWPEQQPVAVPGARELAARLGAHCGPVVTVSTATGTEERAGQLAERHSPLAEAMEGAGVALAAVRAGVLPGELRAVSNPVGDRRRASWDLPAALAALQAAAAGLVAGWGPG